MPYDNSIRYCLEMGNCKQAQQVMHSQLNNLKLEQNILFEITQNFKKCPKFAKMLSENKMSKLFTSEKFGS